MAPRRRRLVDNVYSFKPKVAAEEETKALTVDEFFDVYPDHRPVVDDPPGVKVLEPDVNPTGWAWVFYPTSRTGHRWAGWRYAQKDPENVVRVYALPVVRDAVVHDDACMVQHLNQEGVA
jgi:hypothetical protein